MSDRISLIVVNYGTPRLLTNFLVSIDENIDDKTHLEVIVVDNGFPHKGDSRKICKPHKFSFRLKFAQNHQTSYASGVNCGVRLATNDIIVVANSDIEISPKTSLESLTSILKQDARVGIVGPQLLYPGGSWQRSYGLLPSIQEGLNSLFLLDGLIHGINRFLLARNMVSTTAKNVGYVDGAFMIIRRTCFDELKGFDEEYQFYGEDADFCYRAKKKDWKVVFLPTLCVIHLRGASSTQKAFLEYIGRQFHAKLQFVRKNNGQRYANRYRQLIKVVMLQRVLFYTVIAKLLPINELKRRREQSALHYVAIKNLPQT